MILPATTPIWLDVAVFFATNEKFLRCVTDNCRLNAKKIEKCFENYL